MGRIVSMAAALIVLTATWVCAGGFEVLADAVAAPPPTPLFIKAGTVVKADYKGNLKADADVEMETDGPPAAQVAPASAPQVKARPALAFRDRSSGAMAPPPRSSASTAQMTDSSDVDSAGLEADLEKDLVLSPPPSRTGESVKSESKPSEKGAAEPKSAVSGAKVERRAPETKVKKSAGPDYMQYANSGKPIRKVRPVSQNAWNAPAGSYDSRPHRIDARQAVRPMASRQARTGEQEFYGPDSGSQYQEFMVSQPRRVNAPSGVDRFVRDGVTVKLAPPAPGAPQSEYGDDAASDIFSAAAEIIGLPFAFISSMF